MTVWNYIILFQGFLIGCLIGHAIATHQYIMRNKL